MSFPVVDTINMNSLPVEIQLQIAKKNEFKVYDKQSLLIRNTYQKKKILRDVSPKGEDAFHRTLAFRFLFWGENNAFNSRAPLNVIAEGCESLRRAVVDTLGIHILSITMQDGGDPVEYHLNGGLAANVDLTIFARVAAFILLDKIRILEDKDDEYGWQRVLDEDEEGPPGIIYSVNYANVLLYLNENGWEEVFIKDVYEDLERLQIRPLPL